jgi:hypothetical protein
MNITQDNFRLLLPGKIAKAAKMIDDERHCGQKEALLAFYRSALYRELEVEATKRWWESALQLYRDWREEREG